jgi:hypothetical protein
VMEEAVEEGDLKKPCRRAHESLATSGRPPFTMAAVLVAE